MSWLGTRCAAQVITTYILILKCSELISDDMAIHGWAKDGFQIHRLSGSEPTIQRFHQDTKYWSESRNFSWFAIHGQPLRPNRQSRDWAVKPCAEWVLRQLARAAPAAPPFRANEGKLHQERSSSEQAKLPFGEVLQGQERNKTLQTRISIIVCYFTQEWLNQRLATASEPAHFITVPMRTRFPL